MYKEYEAKNKNGTRPIATASVGGVCWGWIFPGGGNEQILGQWRDSPHPTSRENYVS